MTRFEKSLKKILASDLVSICNNFGGMRRPFLCKDRREKRLCGGGEYELEGEPDDDNSEEYWRGTYYSGDGGRCRFCGKFATKLLLCVVDEVDIDYERR